MTGVSLRIYNKTIKETIIQNQIVKVKDLRAKQQEKENLSHLHKNGESKKRRRKMKSHHITFVTKFLLAMTMTRLTW